MGIKIISTGVYLPEEKLKADEAVKSSGGETIDKLFTGGEYYHSAAEFETATYMGARAAEHAIQNAGIDPTTIDAAVGISLIPDYAGPRDIYGMLRDLGLKHVMGWTLDLTCASFVGHLNVANLLSH